MVQSAELTSRGDLKRPLRPLQEGLRGLVRCLGRALAPLLSEPTVFEVDLLSGWWVLLAYEPAHLPAPLHSG